MSKPVSAIKNLGPAMAEAFARAGITTADAVQQLGADAAYATLIASGTRPHFMAYLALALGLEGRPFTDVTPTEKARFRQRFEALKAQAPSPRSDIERALDALGVRPKS